MKLETTVKTINTKEDFINFLEILLLDFKKNNNSWENKSIDTYLEGMQSWVEDMEGYYINNNLPIPENVNWQVFANILIAGKMYE